MQSVCSDAIDWVSPTFFLWEGETLHAWVGGTSLSREYAVASHRRPAPAGASLRTLYFSPPATQNPLGDVKAAYEGRATEQCGLLPTLSACTALSLEQAPTGQPKHSMSASRQPRSSQCVLAA